MQSSTSIHPGARQLAQDWLNILSPDTDRDTLGTLCRWAHGAASLASTLRLDPEAAIFEALETEFAKAAIRGQAPDLDALLALVKLDHLRVTQLMEANSQEGNDQ